MSAEVKKEIELEIAYVLFVDIVGYSKLLIDQQRRSLEVLNQIVRGTEQFRKAERKPSIDYNSDRRWNGAGVLQHAGSAGGMRAGDQSRRQRASRVTRCAWACTAGR